MTMSKLRYIPYLHETGADRCINNREELSLMKHSLIGFI